MTRESLRWISLLAVVCLLAVQFFPVYASSPVHRSAEPHCPNEIHANTTAAEPAMVVPTELVECEHMGSCDGRCCSFCHATVGIHSACIESSSFIVDRYIAVHLRFHLPLLVFPLNRPPSVVFKL